jgi:hypothetical protein
MGQAGGVNLFSYVGDNPVNYIDPEGLISIALRIPIPQIPAPCIGDSCMYAHRTIPSPLTPQDNPPSDYLIYRPGVLSPNIGLIEKLECMAQTLGIPLIISDGRRPIDAPYGVSNSAHKYGEAADVSWQNYGGSKNITPCMIKEAAHSCGIPRACFNPIIRHMHLDTRSSATDCDKWPGYINPCQPKSCRTDEI